MLSAHLRGWRLPFAIAMGAWCIALAYSTLSARALFGDGALYVLVHFQIPNRFDDYDFQRSFSSFITQAPVLFGERLGVERIAAYAALYSTNVYLLPAACLMAALFLARREPALFALNALAIVVFGFGTNFINTEANLLFGLVWLALSIMLREQEGAFLRSFLLPLMAIAMLRIYEGMLLVGPLLAAAAFLAARRTTAPLDRIGLALCAPIFLLGAFLAIGGFVSPRDPGNADNFMRSTMLYFKHPQFVLLLSSVAAVAAAFVSPRAMKTALVAVSAILAVAFLAGIARVEGYYSHTLYYQNRTFLTFFLPVTVAIALAVCWRRPRWLAPAQWPGGYAIVLVPVIFAVVGDTVGTYRWNRYIHEFCAVLRQDMSPAARIEVLKNSGVKTAWPWTHPTLSVLLRDRQSKAMVANEPGQRWEPADVEKASGRGFKGVCEAPLLRSPR